MRVALIVAVTVTAGLFAACRQTDKAAATPQAGTAAAASAAGPRVLATLPEFDLENQQGQLTDLYDLHGSVWVADFIFTRCAGTCPMMTPRMAELQREFASSATL